MHRIRAAPSIAGRIRIGISGWTYPGWRGRFYPKGLRPADELAFASRKLDTIEINATHYRLQRPDSFARWYNDTPRDFSFAVKGSRFVTHLKQLHDIETPLANFFASGVLRLEDKLGPFLWQFSPRFRFDPARFAAFLSALPHDSEAAAQLARRHDHRLAGRAWARTEQCRPLRHAVEIRSERFFDPDFIDLLRRHDVALAFADQPHWPYAEDLTADFVYLRLHGTETLYASSYSDKALDRWAARIRTWARGEEPEDARLIAAVRSPPRPRDVYVYFDNDFEARAAFDAQALATRLANP